MIEETYPLKADPSLVEFTFESIGPKGRIEKIIQFTPFGDGRWNLGFADRRDDKWDDEVVSNNGDLVRVISTVACAAYLFSKKWPKRQIFISPVDEKRKRLYNSIFKRHFQTISATFLILGIDELGIRPFEPAYFYDEFTHS